MIRSPTSLVGAAVATAMAALFVVLLLLELLGFLTNPYIGLLLYVAVPALFVCGLLLIPLGRWLEARRLRRTPGAVSEWPVIDLRNARQRQVAVGVAALTTVNLVIVSIAAYGGVHYMESPSFCGQVCHTTMEPEYVAHQTWPHARVACAQCHIGPGAGAAVEAKLAGTRQLLMVMTNRVPRPIPQPADLIQPAGVTCGQCHSPSTRAGDKIRVIREYASDEANSESVTTLQMHLGTPESTGIHRHINLDIEYVATDSTLDTIPYVRLTDPDGTVREFVAQGTDPAQAAQGVRRTMSCTGCHNRPAHTFFPSPERAVDAALARGDMPRELPFARREAVAAAAESYPSREEALDEIARRLNAFYGSQAGADAGAVARAVGETQAIWSRNVFPLMNVTWGTYPNNLGHLDSPGCFRCHDEAHTAADGSVISQNCELCHAF